MSRPFQCRYCGTPVTWQTAKSGKVYLAFEKRIRLRLGGESLSYPPHICLKRPPKEETA